MMHFLFLNGLSIFHQLRLEEALLRADKREWCLVNTNADPSIVMGISGKREKLLDCNLLQKHPIPVIRRFSGGGTVYIDPDTVFVSFICNRKNFPFSSPKEIMEWSSMVYEPLFPNHFQLRENDYVLEEKKIGGNAQYIQKDRWLHHTSFLWDFDAEKMKYLLFPEKRPLYRGQRDHADFLGKISPLFPDKKSFLLALIKQTESRFPLIHIPYCDVLPLLDAPHRRSTSFIEIQ